MGVIGRGVGVGVEGSRPIRVGMRDGRGGFEGGFNWGFGGRGATIL